MMKRFSLYGPKEETTGGEGWKQTIPIHLRANPLIIETRNLVLTIMRLLARGLDRVSENTACRVTFRNFSN